MQICEIIFKKVVICTVYNIKSKPFSIVHTYIEKTIIYRASFSLKSFFLNPALAQHKPGALSQLSALMGGVCQHKKSPMMVFWLATHTNKAINKTLWKYPCHILCLIYIIYMYNYIHLCMFISCKYNNKNEKF